MALGDSITRATCWRDDLWQQLNMTHASQFHLVGTLSSDNGCTPSGYEMANQGYSSSLITEVVAGVTTNRTCDPNPCPALSDVAAAFTTVKPDVVLLHWGTNDIWNVISPTQIINAYSAVVDSLRTANPNAIVLIAQLIPLSPSPATCSGCTTCPTCDTGIQGLNTKIAAWAPTKSTAASPIIVVDQFTGFDPVADTRDGVHPNDSGSLKMANNWAAALEPLF
jgi:lysophospholipase L1-like esterase